jgi:hypothetical protein
VDVELHIFRSYASSNDQSFDLSILVSGEKFPPLSIRQKEDWCLSAGLISTKEEKSFAAAGN